jgi:hypothetical protein
MPRYLAGSAFAALIALGGLAALPKAAHADGVYLSFGSGPDYSYRYRDDDDRDYPRWRHHWRHHHDWDREVFYDNGYHHGWYRHGWHRHWHHGDRDWDDG